MIETIHIGIVFSVNKKQNAVMSCKENLTLYMNAIKEEDECFQCPVHADVLPLQLKMLWTDR